MCRLSLASLAIIVLFFIPNYDSARILAVFPIPYPSHQFVYRQFTQELAKRGHEVTVVTTDPCFPKGQTPENFTEIDIHDMSYKVIEKFQNKNPTLAQRRGMFKDLLVLQKAMEFFFTTQLRHVKELLENHKAGFDLILLEASMSIYLSLSHVFKARVILLNVNGPDFRWYHQLGVPSHPFLYPVQTQQRIYNLTFWEKVNIMYDYLKQQLQMLPQLESLDTKQVRDVFGPAMPSVKELTRNVDMLFTNTHALWAGNAPVASNVLYVWGIHLKPAKNLPEDLQNQLNSSTNGVIFVSFGSMIKTSSLPNGTMEAIMGALSRVPYDVLLKWEEEELPRQPKNVQVRKWWPQADIMRHPKVRLNINHGGLLSIYEAIISGVPFVSMPIFGDHFFNAERSVHHKIGVKLDIESINEDQLVNAINTVIEDTSYRRNIIKLRSLMRDEPQPALERAVWWTEHVLRHGGAKHLRAPAANLTWGQYYEMPLVATVLIFLTSVIIVALLAVRCVLKLLLIKLTQSKSKIKHG